MKKVTKKTVKKQVKELDFSNEIYDLISYLTKKFNPRVRISKTKPNQFCISNHEGAEAWELKMVGYYKER